MNELIIESMQSYNHYLLNCIRGCDEIVQNIREDNLQQALLLISQFSEGTTWLVEVNRMLGELGCENELKHETIHDFLIEINDGLEMQDFVVVSDMFEYEIKPFFEKCTLYEIPKEN